MTCPNPCPEREHWHCNWCEWFTELGDIEGMSNLQLLTSPELSAAAKSCAEHVRDEHPDRWRASDEVEYQQAWGPL